MHAGLRFSAGLQAGALAFHPTAVPTEPRALFPLYPLQGVWDGVKTSLQSSWGGTLWDGCQDLTAVLWGEHSGMDIRTSLRSSLG